MDLRHPIPQHIAIVMDGNGRWAKMRQMPRVFGHRRGLHALKDILSHCAELGIRYLTVYAFSSENWRRPQGEVSFLMDLFLRSLKNETHQLASNNIRICFVGDRSRFSLELIETIKFAETHTAMNTGISLIVAVDYGGRWEIINAACLMLADHPERVHGFTEADIAPYMAMNFAPEPELFIRTGGEQRISNFLLWHLSYTELYFTDLLWPDFDKNALNEAITWYQKRERRFGQISEQLRSL